MDPLGGNDPGGNRTVPVRVGDEGRYIHYAENLLDGHYTDAENPNLWNGPGYPAILAALKAIGLPWHSARYLNAFLLFGAALFFYYTLALCSTKINTVAATYVLGLYPPFFKDLHLILPEAATIFIVSGFSYFVIRTYRERKAGHAAAAAAFLAYLMLTKIFFAYAVPVWAVSCLVLKRVRSGRCRAAPAAIAVAALMLCTPYLWYTYTLTGKPYYWGNSGGLSLYWMSTPHSGEFGEWHPPDLRHAPALIVNHSDFFATLSDLSHVEQDERLKKRAVANIRENPQKFAINWVANLGRLLFSYPFSYRLQTPLTYLIMLPNMLLFAAMVCCIYPTLRKWNSIAPDLRFLLIFALASFLGTSLLSAYERQFRPLVPIVLLWINYIIARVIRISWRDKSD